jgi:hypothetical protein
VVNPRIIGHGNAMFLAALQEPNQTKSKLRDRVKSGEFPGLWKGAGMWVELARVPA